MVNVLATPLSIQIPANDLRKSSIWSRHVNLHPHETLTLGSQPWPLWASGTKLADGRFLPIPPPCNLLKYIHTYIHLYKIRMEQR